MSIRVTVWNEYRHEKESEEIAAVYPNGIHAAIAEGLEQAGGFEVRTATLDEPEHGLTDEVLANTDVLTWWGHKAHGAVSDEIVTRVQKRVLDGMGLVVLFNATGVPKSLFAVGVGHVVINLPLCFAILYSQMNDNIVRLEQAARDLGAKEWQVLALVVAPVLWPALAASFVLSLTLSWDEFLIAFLLTRFETTLPVEIWTLLRSGLNPKANAIGAIVFAVSIVMVVLAELAIFGKGKKRKS